MTTARTSLDDLTLDPTLDPTLTQALDRISDLSARLWAVRLAHRPVAVGRLRRSVVCAGCGLPTPCPTLRAAG